MEFDQTQIAVRERKISEVFDLALQLLRSVAVPMAALTTLAAVASIALHLLLLGWMLDEENFETMQARFVVQTIELVFLETMLFSVFTTLLLGRNTFGRSIAWREILRDVRKFAPRWLVVVFLFRVLLPGWCFASLSIVGPVGDTFLAFATIYALLTRLFRPFLLEIVLLEQLPLRGSKGMMTAPQRSRLLHGPNSGEMLFQGMVCGLTAVVLTVGMLFFLRFGYGMLTNDWTWGRLAWTFLLPLALWSAAAVMSVVRFLLYLNLRIRCEGWEVELRVRAAAEQLMRKNAHG